MECPRCDRPLERYALGGREAVSCDRCGYIGVPVEHHGELREFESWDDALSRFHEVGRVRAGTVETGEDPTPEVLLEDVDEEPTPTVVRVETPEDPVPADAETNGEGDADSTADVSTEDGAADGVTCTVCGEEFDDQAQLDGHSAVHSGREE